MDNPFTDLRWVGAARPLRYKKKLVKGIHMTFVSPSNFAPFFVGLVLAAFSSGCGRAEFAFSPSAFAQTNPPTVCAPFDPGNPGSDQTGLAGRIKYLEATQARVTNVGDLLANGKDAGVQLVLNSLDVPTVRFTQGFVDSGTSAPLKTSAGAVLNEWFAIDVRSELILSDSETDGFYQLAFLSDDGAVLDIDATLTAAGTRLIDNDGEHSTRMGCASKAVYLKKSETRPIRVKYFQGPREHISLTLMWRKVAAENAAKDVLCGASGNDYFWNSNVTPSAPTAKYNELVSRGWKIPRAKNFILPPDVRTNPCSKTN